MSERLFQSGAVQCSAVRCGAVRCGADIVTCFVPSNRAPRKADTWRALEELYDQGVIRALGVSNFDARELRALVATARVRPMVVQNKLDPYHIGKIQAAQSVID